MKIVMVYVENPIFEINQAYSYLYDGEISIGLRVIVPFGNGNKEIVGLVNEVKELTDEDPSKLKTIISVIDEVSLLNDELLALAKYMEISTVSPFMACVQAMLPSYLKPKGKDHQERMIKYCRGLKINNEVLTPKQKIAYDELMSVEEMVYSEFRSKYGGFVAALHEKKAMELFEKAKEADLKYNYEEDIVHILNDEQTNCIKQIEACDKFNPFLLFGVTGSGKTEVYLKCAEDTISKGQEVIILVPEIGLTPQMVKRVKLRFKNQVAIYHSRLSIQERYEQYQLILRGKVKIVVGTRSAIFMPFRHLGLIILDEEHDHSYKQDSSPRYHARDIALFRAKYHNCPLLLASATPSFESYARAGKQVYTLLELKNRIAKRMPICELVDMKEELKTKNFSLISRTLKAAIIDCINKGEQAIILFNRRGYAPSVNCKKCKEPIKCPHCDVALAYHKDGHKLKCHYCDYEENFPKVCKKCGHEGFEVTGFGIQKLEEELNIHFKDYRLIRMDRDTTSKKNAHELLINAFENHEADILIGTQMIAKGLDFENVTVVGILNADQGLNRGDFRSVEETYQLVSQACGRSGRATKLGKVLIQSYDPTNYALRFAANHDYQHFYNQEMAYRHMGNYPPYCYLSSIMCLDKNAEKALACIKDIKLFIGSLNLDVKIYGPSELIKIQDNYRYRLLVKTKDLDLLIEQMNIVMQEFKVKQKQRIKLVIDINPGSV